MAVAEFSGEKTLGESEMVDANTPALALSSQTYELLLTIAVVFGLFYSERIVEGK